MNGDMPLVDFSDEELLIMTHYLGEQVRAIDREISEITEPSRDFRRAVRVNRDAAKLLKDLKGMVGE